MTKARVVSQKSSEAYLRVEAKSHLHIICYLRNNFMYRMLRGTLRFLKLNLLHASMSSSIFTSQKQCSIRRTKTWLQWWLKGRFGYLNGERRRRILIWREEFLTKNKTFLFAKFTLCMTWSPQYIKRMKIRWMRTKIHLKLKKTSYTFTVLKEEKRLVILKFSALFSSKSTKRKISWWFFSQKD